MKNTMKMMMTAAAFVAMTTTFSQACPSEENCPAGTAFLDVTPSYATLEQDGRGRNTHNTAAVEIRNRASTERNVTRPVNSRSTFTPNEGLVGATPISIP